MARRDPVPPDSLTVVRAFWEATRDRDVDAAMALMHPDVEWISLLDDADPDGLAQLAGGTSTRGAEALRLRFEEIAGSGVVAEAYALSYELLDDGRVLVVGALRVRRPDNWMTTVQRWWVYVLEDGLIRRFQAYATREAACASPVDS